jgi:UDP-N-acetylmuramoylalanine--D-glutamate ligase
MVRPVVLILGGKDKGNDYTEIEQLVEKKVKGLVFLGVDNNKLHAFFDKMGKPTTDARSMEEAVAQATQMAAEGDVVLLSPCCASFDLFKSYEDRGEQFKECVNRLK